MLMAIYAYIYIYKIRVQTPKIQVQTPKIHVQTPKIHVQPKRHVETPKIHILVRIWQYIYIYI